MNRKEFLINQATKLLNEGLSVIAVDGYKKSVFAWKDFTEDRITEKALADQINNEKAFGVAVICGAVSGGLEVIDFDLKYDLTGDLMKRYNEKIPEALLNRLRIIKTTSGGFHYYYRCEEIEGNKKLAARPATPEELKASPHLKQLVLIETRGTNGYVVAPPTDGYEIVQNNPIPVISVDDRSILLDAARSFHQVHTEEATRFISTGTPFLVSPFDDFNAKTDAVSLLTKHGWTIDSTTKKAGKTFLIRPGTTTATNSGNFQHDRNLFYVWTTSTQFTPEKAYSPSAIFAILEHNGDFSEASKDLIKKGFGVRNTPEGRKENKDKKFIMDHKFWFVNDKGKPVIILPTLVTFIYEVGGFCNYRYTETSENILVQVKDGLVKEVEIYDVKQFLKTWILTGMKDENGHEVYLFDGIDKDALLAVVYNEYQKFLSTGFMDFLNVSEFEFLKDTRTSAYFPFLNGIVEVTKDGAKLHKYGTLKTNPKDGTPPKDFVLWRSQLINRTITIQDKEKNQEPEDRFKNYDFYRFLCMASGNTPAKISFFSTTIGYLLHKYKDPKNTFAIILAEETENEAEGGGTGKGLFVKAIKELIPTEIFDGKQFSAGKAFAFQRVSLDTKLIAIEDAKRGFRFEELYSFITEGLPVEKKNQKEFFIPFQDSPKIIISTNYVISDEGNHAKRRQRVLEFSNFFSPDRTPFDFLGRMMFEDWDTESGEYDRFYTFLFYCVQTYLSFGKILTVDQSETNKIKNIKLKYTEDLLLFYNNLTEGFPEEEPTNELYTKFLDSYGLNSKTYDKRRFLSGLRYIATTLGHKMTEGVKKIEGKSQRWLKIEN